MSAETLIDAKYRRPAFSEFPRERCRDCAERERDKSVICGVAIRCRLHARMVEHVFRCDRWHAPGTLV